MRLVYRYSAVSALIALSAQRPADPKPPWALSMDNVVRLDVPAALRDALGDLEYDDTSTVRGVLVDLNGDGVRDYLVQAAASLCGNGGCPYEVFDGATLEDLGQIAGNPLYVLSERSRGYPVIATYSHLSAAAGSFTRYAFDGTAYVMKSRLDFAGPHLDSLTAELGKIPMWRPGGVR